MTWRIKRPTRITQGEEYNNGEPIKGSSFKYSFCDSCGTEIIEVKDDERNGLYGYLGKQEQISKNYTSSPAITKLREFYKQNNIKDNNLYNVHSKLHVRKKGSKKLIDPNPYCKDNYRLLCNNCYDKTYRRVSVDVRGGLVFDVTVLPYETLGDVIVESGISYIDPKTGRDPELK